MVVREMQRNPQLGLEPVGFLDDDRAKLGKPMQGVPRAGAPRRNSSEVVVARDVDEVVIAMPKAPGAVLRSLVQSTRAEAGVPAKVVPGRVRAARGRRQRVSRLREVDITDLLRRRPIVAAPDTRRLPARPARPRDRRRRVDRQRAVPADRQGRRRGTLVLLGHGENSIFDIAEQLRQTFPAVDDSVR